VKKKKGRAFGPTRDFEFVRKGINGDWLNHLECMLEPVRIIGVAKKPARNEV